MFVTKPCITIITMILKFLQSNVMSIFRNANKVTSCQILITKLLPVPLRKFHNECLCTYISLKLLCSRERIFQVVKIVNALYLSAYTETNLPFQLSR